MAVNQKEIGVISNQLVESCCFGRIHSFFLVHGILLENSRFYFTAIVLTKLNFMVYR